MNRKSKSPYKTLFSSTRNKVAQDTTRQVYLNDLPLKNTNINRSEK